MCKIREWVTFVFVLFSYSFHTLPISRPGKKEKLTNKHIIDNRLTMVFGEMCVLGVGDLLSLLRRLAGSQLPRFPAIFITVEHQESRRDETRGGRLMMWSTLETGRWCSQATDKAPSADTLESVISLQWQTGLFSMFFPQLKWVPSLSKWWAPANTGY